MMWSGFLWTAGVEGLGALSAFWSLSLICSVFMVLLYHDTSSVQQQNATAMSILTSAS